MPGEVVFVINPVGYERAFHSWTGSPLGTWMVAKTQEVQIASIIEAPGPGKVPNNRTGWNYGTGELQAGIVSQQDRADNGKDLEGHVTALAEHAKWVHDGTLPHIIIPKKAKVLKFRTRTGKLIHAKIVKHPGTASNPFLVRALERALRQG